jgi:hypothetical protein
MAQSAIRWPGGGSSHRRSARFVLHLTWRIPYADTGLTPEQRRLVDDAGDRPVRIDDPELHQAYILIRADLYERVRNVIEPRSGAELSVPEGIRRSQEAFFRDLPVMLKNRRLLGRYVAYRGNEREKIGRSEVEVIRECLRRGLTDDEYDVFVVEPQNSEPEEIQYPSACLVS